MSNNIFYNKNAKLIIRASIYKEYKPVKYAKKLIENIEI